MSSSSGHLQHGVDATNKAIASCLVTEAMLSEQDYRRSDLIVFMFRLTPEDLLGNKQKKKPKPCPLRDHLLPNERWRIIGTVLSRDRIYDRNDPEDRQDRIFALVLAKFLGRMFGPNTPPQNDKGIDVMDRLLAHHHATEAIDDKDWMLERLIRFFFKLAAEDMLSDVPVERPCRPIPEIDELSAKERWAMIAEMRAGLMPNGGPVSALHRSVLRALIKNHDELDLFVCGEQIYESIDIINKILNPGSPSIVELMSEEKQSEEQNKTENPTNPRRTKGSAKKRKRKSPAKSGTTLGPTKIPKTSPVKTRKRQ